MTPSRSPAELYEELGYYLHPEPIVPAPLLRRALDRIAALIREDYDTGVPPWRRLNVGDPRMVQKIDQVHVCDKAFHLLATHPAVGELVARTTGADLVQVWATQLFLKPAHGADSGAVGWHTDRETWPFWEGEVLTVWLALDEVALESGPVLYVEGSHRWPDAEKHGDAYVQDLDVLEAQIKLLAPPRPWRKVPVLLQAGGAGVHMADIIHGSAANTSDLFRVGMAINVRTEKSRPRQGVEDYGYASFLHHPFLCPVIYQRDRARIAEERADLDRLREKLRPLLEGELGERAVRDGLLTQAERESLTRR